jgi:hypothetical protein
VTERRIAVVCEHLAALERDLIGRGIAVTFRGRAWSENCREWVYFDCVLDLPALRARLALPEYILDHAHLGTHDGCEAGVVCPHCHDAVMGLHPDRPGGRPVIS